jgi:hypothetical protein
MHVLLRMRDANGIEAVLTGEPLGADVRLTFRIRGPNQPLREKDFGIEPRRGDGVIELIDGLRETFSARGFVEVNVASTH